MSVLSVKALLGLGILIAGAMLLAAASREFSPVLTVVFIACGIAVLGASLLWYGRAGVKAQAREDEAHARRAEELKRELDLIGSPIVVKLSGGLFITLFLILLSVTAIYRAIVEPTGEAFLLGCAAVLLTAVVVLVLVPVLTKPELLITCDGLDTPGFGFLSWEEIDSIGLQQHSHKGITTHTLDLLVPKLHERDDQMHPCTRFVRRLRLLRRRDFVVIGLRRSSIPPKVVHRLCLGVWTQRTGKKPRTWTSLISDRHLEEFRQQEERFARFDRARKLAGQNPTEAIEVLKEIESTYAHLDQQKPKRLSKRSAALQAAFMAEMKTIDPRDERARKVVFDRYVQDLQRTTWTTWVVTGLVFVVLVIGILMLV